MITWHGFDYGYDENRNMWYVTNRKTNQTKWFADYNSANFYVETHRA